MLIALEASDTTSKRDVIRGEGRTGDWAFVAARIATTMTAMSSTQTVRAICQYRQAARLAKDHASMSGIVLVQDADGNRISGRFYVSDGMITALRLIHARRIAANIAKLPELLIRPQY